MAFFNFTAEQRRDLCAILVNADWKHFWDSVTFETGIGWTTSNTSADFYKFLNPSGIDKVNNYLISNGIITPEEGAVLTNQGLTASATGDTDMDTNTLMLIMLMQGGNGGNDMTMLLLMMMMSGNNSLFSNIQPVQTPAGVY